MFNFDPDPENTPKHCMFRQNYTWSGRIFYYWQILILFVFVSCQTADQKDQHSKIPGKDLVGDKDSSLLSKFEKKPISGKVTFLDSMPAPKRILAGIPRVVPYKNFTSDVIYPKTISIPEKQVIIVPGKDSIPEPNVYKAQIEDYRFIYPEAKTTMPPKMKYGANGYTRNYSKMQGIGGGKMYKIVQDKDENLWFMDHDLVKFDGTHVMRFKHIINNNNKETTYLGLQDILEDSKGNLWFLRGSHIIPTNRIMKYDGTDVKVITALDKTGNPMAWRYTCMYEDTFGNIWIGNMFTGLLKYESTGQDNPDGKFIHFTKECGLPGEQISCITGSINGNLWIGTQDAGFYKYQHGSEEYPNGRFIQFSTKDGLSSNHITSITEADDGKLWIGTYRGLNIFDPGDNTFQNYKSNPKDHNSLSHDFVWAIYEDKHSNIWVGTYSGLNRFIKESGLFIRYLYNAEDEFSISNNNIASIYEDDEGIYWIATMGGGLNRFDPSTEKFTSFTMKDGLPNNVTYATLEDQDGNFWIPTNWGLSKF
ncbi:MAG: hypothetical protein K8R53_16400, partial [Bacteroidales bacterium]|nr:hypothetical protein [Bacteroidales bacterium]